MIGRVLGGEILNTMASFKLCEVLEILDVAGCTLKITRKIPIEGVH